MKSEHELLLADYRESESRFPAILKLFTFVSGNIPAASQPCPPGLTTSLETLNHAM